MSASKAMWFDMGSVEIVALGLLVKPLFQRIPKEWLLGIEIDTAGAINQKIGQSPSKKTHRSIT